MDTQIKTFSFEGKKVIDSRDVAKMIGKEHKNLIRDIRHYIKVMGNSSKLSPSNFFIEMETGKTRQAEVNDIQEDNMEILYQLVDLLGIELEEA